MALEVASRAERLTQPIIKHVSQMGRLWQSWHRRARRMARVGASVLVLVLAAAGSAMAHGDTAAASNARLWSFSPVHAWMRQAHHRAAAAPVHALRQMDGRPVLQVLHVIATAYGPTYAANYPYGPVDAYGRPLAPGMVAVDPRVIPMRSTLFVTGYHDRVLPASGFVGRAMDTGGAIAGHRIDIFMNQGRAAVSQFGIEPVTVYVLGVPAAPSGHNTQSAPPPAPAALPAARLH